MGRVSKRRHSRDARRSRRRPRQGKPPHLAPELDRRLAETLQAQEDWLREHPTLRAEERDDARREALRAERAMLTSLYNDGVLSEHVYSELVTEVDAALQAEPVEEPTPPEA